MDDLTVAGIESVHRSVLQDIGGDSRVLSEANLHQLVFSANRIPGCLPRAAFVFWYLCAFPAFRERNSHTALAVIEQILASGGFRITGTKGEILHLAGDIIALNREPGEIEEWLSRHVKELSEP